MPRRRSRCCDCRATSSDCVQRDTRQLVLSILVRQPADAKPAMMMNPNCRLGLQALRPSRCCSRWTDNGQPGRSRSIQDLHDTGCFVGMPVPDKFLTSMPESAELKLTVPGQCRGADRPQPCRLLWLFGPAYDKVKSGRLSKCSTPVSYSACSLRDVLLAIDVNDLRHLFSILLSTKSRQAGPTTQLPRRNRSTAFRRSSAWAERVLGEKREQLCAFADARKRDGRRIGERGAARRCRAAPSDRRSRA